MIYRYAKCQVNRINGVENSSTGGVRLTPSLPLCLLGLKGIWLRQNLISAHFKVHCAKNFWSLSSCRVWPVRPVRSWMERTRSQNWFWPEWPCSLIRAAQFSRSHPKRKNLEGCGGYFTTTQTTRISLTEWKSNNIRARLGHFALNWPELVLFGRLFLNEIAVTKVRVGRGKQSNHLWTT